MKRLISALIRNLFFIFISVGTLRAQTIDDAISFLNTNIPDWACERFAYGTTIPRITFKYYENMESGHLELMVKKPEYSFYTDYYSVDITLKEVMRVEIVNTGKNCGYIRIVTKEKGLMTINRNRDKLWTELNQDYYSVYNQIGWYDDNIRLRIDEDFKPNSERVKKAIEFLAVKSGAKLVESHF